MLDQSIDSSQIEFIGGCVLSESAIDYLADKGTRQLYLDCVHGIGFLPAYYKRLGFEVVVTKNIDFPKCGPTDMVLMRRDIATG